MADLSTHYKEITPEQTVQNIIDFFTRNNFTLDFSGASQSEAGTWYCHVDLFKNGVKVGGANGKGMTKEYATASGYAELYERFCNQISFISSPFWTTQYMKRNKEKNGYYFRAGEKIQTYDEMYHCCRRATEYLDHFSGEDEEIAHAMIDLFMGNTYVGAPMQSINDPDDKIYVDPRLLMRIIRSNGMAAGNTVTEALVQGLSEVVEREACYHLFNDANDVHYAINLEKIANPNLQEIIQNIHNAGYEFYLFDLSYNSGFPVIMSLLLNKKDGILNINFGSFPVFDIAAERVLTELYQGIKSYKGQQFQGRLQKPYKAFPPEFLYMTYGNSISGEIFPLSFFNNIRYMDSYNDKVFVNQNRNNDELLQYYRDLAKTVGCKFYYIDNSLCSEVAAVYIIMESTDLYKAYSICQTIPMEWNEYNKEIALQEIKNYKYFYTEMLNNRKISIDHINYLTQNIYNREISTGRLLDNTMLWNAAFATNAPDSSWAALMPLFNISNDEEIFIPANILGNECYHAYKKYVQLASYVRTNQYSYDELIQIFNEIFDYKITQEDINKCMSPAYLIQRAYIDPLRQFINGEDYHAIIDTYINNIPS